MNATVTKCARRAMRRILGGGSLRYEKRIGHRASRRAARTAIAGHRGDDIDIQRVRPRTGWDVA